VKLRVFAQDETLLNGVVFTSDAGDQTLTLTLKNAMKDHWLAEVKGITEKNGADSLRGTKLYIERTALPPLDDEFYIEDLKDMRVVDRNGALLGVVSDIVNYGASDILEIKPENGPAILLPFTDDVILTIDAENGVITAQLPEVL
jgi:16S rRNA processing protein RimM